MSTIGTEGNVSQEANTIYMDVAKNTIILGLNESWPHTNRIQMNNIIPTSNIIKTQILNTMGMYDIFWISYKLWNV